ncbi:hypothetical protein RAS1_08420 [Phycisphaerae bacterium RAS1]|nr:hypothetical protein RAS1_08420 [Phycisphaerae bacterium RAS1]
MNRKPKRLQKAADMSNSSQYKDFFAEIVAMIKAARGKLAAMGQLEAFDKIAAEGDRQVRPSRRRRPATKKQQRKGRRKSS